jgi:hypothetical protein
MQPPQAAAAKSATCVSSSPTPGALPFADLLPAEQVEQALQEERVTYRDRLFSPLVTLWVSLSQVLDPDHSCRAAVARSLTWRGARGLASCSDDPSAYGKARHRLPEGVLARLTRATGRQPQDQAPAAWRWNGRTVKLADGTTVSMPDTPANQKALPQSPSQKPGVGFRGWRSVRTSQSSDGLRGAWALAKVAPFRAASSSASTSPSDLGALPILPLTMAAFPRE